MNVFVDEYDVQVRCSAQDFCGVQTGEPATNDHNPFHFLMAAPYRACIRSRSCFLMAARPCLRLRAIALALRPSPGLAFAAAHLLDGCASEFILSGDAGAVGSLQNACNG